jgi:hypothetical protein
MFKKNITYVIAGLLVLAATLQTATARLYDNFSTNTNWTLSDNEGSATIETNVLTLYSPNSLLSSPTATLIPAQKLTGSRQSILVEAHNSTDVTNKTVFFLWAYDTATSNKLELKLDDVGPTTVVAGYIVSGVYHFVGSVPYAPGSDGLYMAFRETNGMTYWETSIDAVHWTEVASASDPVSTSNMKFQLQHKAYNITAAPTYTDVGCFNYMLHGAGYLSLEDKTNSGGQGWGLYTEGFSNGVLVCSSQPPETPCGMNVNGVDSSQHFTDTSIPEPYTNQDGYNFEIENTEEPTTHFYYNAYRYQTLPFVDADQWTYHLYFKYTYPQFITQGLEFPLNKYTGTNRLQAAFAWYPLRNGTDNGQWDVWTGSGGWVSTGQDQELMSNWWYEITFTVGLHDNKVYYNGFQAGDVGGLTSFTWNHSYSAPGSGTGAAIVPAMQQDDNTQDTTTAGTQKNCYMAEWHITWMYQRLP